MKKIALKKVRVNKAKEELAKFKNITKAYATSIHNRQSVEHSRTPGIVTREGKTGPANILITELVTIVKTADKLNKLVVLGVNGDTLVMLLEDRVPEPPYQLFY